MDCTFNKTLNSHGYPFQYAVVQAAKDACAKRKSCWIFEASEFPVQTNHKDTKIDLVLKSNDKDHNYLLIGECKRVNPAYGCWCFVKAPIVRRNGCAGKFNMESLEKMRANDPLKVMTKHEFLPEGLFYNIGIAIKNNKAHGNSSGSRDNDAIEKAASQVCRGVNGLIQLVLNINDSAMFRKVFFPVIFTTATLWASDCDLTQTDLTTGNIDLTNSQLERKPWVLYQYHLTPGIKHSIESHQSSKELTSILDFDYMRTIPIVNAGHVEEFLNWLRPFDYF